MIVIKYGNIERERSVDANLIQSSDLLNKFFKAFLLYMLLFSEWAWPPTPTPVWSVGRVLPI